MLLKGRLQCPHPTHGCPRAPSGADCAKGLHPSSPKKLAVAFRSLEAGPIHPAAAVQRPPGLEGFLRQAPVSAKKRMFWKSRGAVLGWEFHVGWNVWFWHRRRGGRRPWGGRLGRPGGRESQRWKWEHSRQAELRGERGEGRETGGRGKARRATLSRAHTPLQRQPGIHRPSQGAVLPRLHPTPHPPPTHGSAKGPVTTGLRMQPYGGALSSASALVHRLRPF